MHQLTCQFQDHQQQEIQVICMNDNCNKPHVGCFNCLRQFHNNHVDDILQLNEFAKLSEKALHQIDIFKQFFTLAQEFCQDFMLFVNSNPIKLNFENMTTDQICQQVDFVKQIKGQKIEKQDDLPFDGLKKFHEELKAMIKRQNKKQFEILLKQNHEEIIFQQIIKSIQVESDNNLLTFKTITQILEKSLDLAKGDYVRITVENRRQRREFRKTNAKIYQQLVLEYNKNIVSLFEEKQEVICRVLDINADKLEKSIRALMERGFFEQIIKIQTSIGKRIQESISSLKNISVCQSKQIIKYYLQLLQQKPRDLQDIINKLATDQETAQLIPLAVNTVLADWVFEIFEIEEEDLIKIMKNSENFADQQMQVLLMQIDETLQTIMSPMIES